MESICSTNGIDIISQTTFFILLYFLKKTARDYPDKEVNSCSNLILKQQRFDQSRAHIPASSDDIPAHFHNIFDSVDARESNVFINDWLNNIYDYFKKNKFDCNNNDLYKGRNSLEAIDIAYRYMLRFVQDEKLKFERKWDGGL